MSIMYADTRLGGVAEWVYGDPRKADMGVPRQLIDCVCYLCTYINGKWRYGGTGFFLGYPSKGYKFLHLYIVTAKHNLDGIKDLGGEVWIRVNMIEGEAKQFRVLADWHLPESPSVDLAVLPFNFPQEGLAIESVPLHTIYRPEPWQPQRFSPGDELLVTGLFSLRYGTQKNYPIVRAGILSAMLDEPLKDKDGREYEAYLAEVRSIGGLSGSPVFAVDRPKGQPQVARNRVQFGEEVRSDFLSHSGEVPVMTPREYYLLGLIRGHWDMDKKNKRLVPAFYNDFELQQVNMGIATVTPAEEIGKILNSERLKAERLEREREDDAENAATLD